MAYRAHDVRETLCQSSGEWLLQIGKLAGFLLRHGVHHKQVAREIGVGERVCLLAVTFLGSPDWLKLRALVEDWNLLVIRTRLRRLSQAVSP